MNNSHSVIDEKEKQPLLKKGLRGNAAFSAISGTLSLIAAPSLAVFTGISAPAVFYILGLVLIPYAAFLWWVSSKKAINLRFAWAAVILDVLWVLGSTVILISGTPELTVAGRWVIFFLAEIVGAFAIIQFLGLRRYLSGK